MIEELRRAMPDLSLSTDRPYRELTSLGVGGVLPILAEPATEDELIRLLRYLRRKKTAFFILGGGTNLVGMDEPYGGVGVRLNRNGFGEIRREGELVFCGAMARLPLLASFAAKAGLHGMSALAGIPGGVGGAVRMNASCRGTAISDVIDSLHGVRFNGDVWDAKRGDIKWEYRGSDIPDDVVITSAVLKLAPGDAADEQRALEAELEQRRKSEPSGRSAGCVFRNFSPEKPAGMLIDRCGLRGGRIGDLEVSTKHANYIVNTTGSGTEADFLTLARLVRRTVRERFGCVLKPEVRFISAASADALLHDRPAGRRSPNTTGAFLLSICRWLYRLTLLLAASTLILAAIGVRGTSIEAFVVLLAGAGIILSSELVYNIFKRLEKI